MEEIEIRSSDDTLRESMRSVRLRSGETTILIDYKRSGEVKIFERRADLIEGIKNVTPASDAPQP